MMVELEVHKRSDSDNNRYFLNTEMVKRIDIDENKANILLNENYDNDYFVVTISCAEKIIGLMNRGGK